MVEGERVPATRDRAWVEWVVAAALFAVPAAKLLLTFWRGDGFVPDALPGAALYLLFPAWLLVVILLPLENPEFWRRHLRAILLAGGVVLSWAALWPVGRFVKDSSIAESKRRMEAIAEAAEEFRSRTGRHPLDLAELRRVTAHALPSASYGYSEWRVMNGRSVVSFGVNDSIDSHTWHWDSATRSWEEWAD